MLKFRMCIHKSINITFIVALLTGYAVNVFADGLPGEYYVTQRWRDLFAGHSPATNPAFMTEENYFTVRGAVCPILENAFILYEGGAILPIGLYQSVGFTVLGVASREDIPQMEWNEQQQRIVATGDTLNDNHNLFIFSYAINPWNRLSIGANANVFYETNFGDPKTGISLDLALSYRFLRHGLLGDHVAGVTFQNILSPDFSFEELQTYSVDLKISWLAKIWEKRIEAGIDLDIKDFMSKAEDFTGSVVGGSGGAEERVLEAAKTIEFDFNSRIGFWLLRMINAYFQIGSGYWGFSGGLNVPTVNNGRDLQILYQYMNITDDPIAFSHTMYIRGDFGKHREEIYARKMARLASIGPGDLYNRARTYFSQGKYWDAFFIFGKIFVEYPDFFKNDWVKLFYGLCQENLDMRDFSIKNLNETKKLYPRSVVVPYADLGIMRINYRNGNSDGVANQFSRLNTATVPDSLKFHAYYYMGQQHLKDGQYQEAIRLFDLIPESHPEYPFAQHSLAVASALSDNVSRSIEALDNTIQTTPTSKSQEEIINRSFVFLGYIFYEGLGGEERALSKAISALRKVPNTSYYYEDALIGRAWTALKASQWADCIAASKELQTVSKKTSLQSEGVLLEAYCYMIDKKYMDAATILRPAFDKISAAIGPSEDKKSAKKLEYDKDRDIYHEVAAKADELASTSQSSYSLKQIDSLHVPQQESEKRIRDFHVYLDEFVRSSFFARNIETVKEDIEYALAKAEKMAGTKADQRVIQRAQEDAQEIDEEMEKLQRELEALEEEEGMEEEEVIEEEEPMEEGMEE